MENPRDKRKTRRYFIIGIILTILLAVFPVRVQYGSLEVCEYGDVIKDERQSRLVPWWLAGAYQVDEDVSICSVHALADKLIDELEEALRLRDLKRAAAIQDELDVLPADIVAAVANAKVVSSGALTARKGGDTTPTPSGGATTEPDGTSGDGGSPPGSDGSTGGSTSPPGQVFKLLPTSVPGYTVLYEEHSPLVSSQFLAPTSGQESYLYFVVQFIGEDARALTLRRKSVELVYGMDAKSFTLSGADTYFGTDGGEYAALSWVKNGVMYEVVGEKEETPKDLFDDLVAIAGLFK